MDKDHPYTPDITSEEHNALAPADQEAAVQADLAWHNNGWNGRPPLDEQNAGRVTVDAPRAGEPAQPASDRPASPSSLNGS